MRLLLNHVLYFGACLALLQLPAAYGASDSDTDALNLESAEAKAPQGKRDTRIFVEGAVGKANQRYLPGSQNLGRASFDLSYTARFGPGLRLVISDRLDQIHPRDPGLDETVNSLREAYVSWQPDGGNSVLEFGRINLRYGPGYGYNPTDFFRDGSLRALTSADPFALRENRLGSVMLRGQQLWNGGSLSVAYSPKLDNAPSVDGWSLDLGSTNNRDRWLLALGTQFSQRVNSQILLYKEAGRSATLGANLTALLSDAATAHVEWSHGREPELLSRALALPGGVAARNRLVGGVTYTTVGKLSVTAEYQYNGFGLSESRWATLGGAPLNRFAYLREALRLQELAPREAILIYVTQRNLFVKDLNLSAYIRFNPGDKSRLGWIELRRQWPSFDVAFQLQRNMGRPTSEFGILPDRRIMQLLGTYYF